MIVVLEAVIHRCVSIKLLVEVAFLHDVDLTIQTLVVNLNDMLLLGLLNDPPYVVHVTSFGLFFDLLNDSWVLWNYVVRNILL